MILIIDNYDSFTYNLFQYFSELSDLSIQVVRNDNLTIEQCLQLNPKYVVISPGPCTPNEAGISTELIKTIAGKIPLLGVCLGHQCIGQASARHENCRLCSKQFATYEFKIRFS